MEKFQGSLEMLFVIGATLAVTALVMYFLVFNSNQQANDMQYNSCREAASQCSMLKNSSNGMDPCKVCDRSCVKSGTITPIATFGGVSAVDCCKRMQVSKIFAGSTSC